VTRQFSVRALLFIVAAVGALAIVPRVAGGVLDGPGTASGMRLRMSGDSRGGKGT
jgi:hypothetical protein